jgi:outer membrane receptor protein involved in Fe transport
MYQRSDVNSAAVQNFIIRGLYTVRNGGQITPFYDLSEKQVNSLYGAAEFSYNDVLFVNLTARNDWFSTLSPANRSILYPSVTASFVFSQAFAGLPDWLSFGKIRAGYAEVGSDLDVAPYSNNLFYDVNQLPFPGANGSDQRLGNINTATVPNLALKPMRVSEKEVGLDIKLFDNRIGLDVAYYDKLTTDQIVGVQVSDASGYTNRLINVGESKNSGIEMLLSLTPVKTSSFQWDFTFNGSYNTSEILKLGPNPGDREISVGRGLFEGELRQVVGKPIGQLYAYDYRRDEQGRQVFDGTSGRPLRTLNPMAVGTAIPKWVGGFTNTFNYKGISLSFLIDFKLGHKMISATNFNAWRHGLHKGTLAGRAEGYVIGDGVNPNGEVNAIQTPVQTFYETVRSANLLGQFVYNAGFWKLRQITLGYDFTKLLPQNFFVKGVRLNAVANNVAILKKWVPNIDPESFGFSSDNVNGLEATGLPTTRSVGFNLNVKF